MQKMILVSEDELRALISEELKSITPSIPKLEEEQPVSQQEICNFLNITEPTIITWRKKGLIPFLKINSRILYQKSAVLTALNSVKKGGKR